MTDSEDHRGSLRLVDRPKATWYLATNLPRPGGPHDPGDAAHQAADLTEVVRLYGIRHWIEQSYKQVKDELGWADFQVRYASAIRRHQTLVNCAFSFCWNTWFDPPPTTNTRGWHAFEPQAMESAGVFDGGPFPFGTVVSILAWVKITPGFAQRLLEYDGAA